MRYNSPLARILANVEVNKKTGCWEWQGKTVTNASGHKYGRINGRLYKQGEGLVHTAMLTHRFVLHFITGLPIAGLVGAHKCDNPICCNPKHLTAVTQTENMQDCVAKGRTGAQRAAA